MANTHLVRFGGQPAWGRTFVGDLFPGTFKHFLEDNNLPIGWITDSGSFNKDFDRISEVLDSFVAREFITNGSMPRINAYYDESSMSYVIEAAIAGLRKDDIKVTAESGCLIFEHSATKDVNGGDKNIKMIIKEISSANSIRRIKLPDTADIDKIESKYADGVITITIPIKESSKPKQLTF